MNLNDYIKEVGRAKAAEVFGVTPGAIGHWVTGRRNPSPQIARSIVEKTHGLVSFNGIYSMPQSNNSSESSERK